METPADWTPYPRDTEDDQPMTERAPAPVEREEPPRAGNGGGDPEHERIATDIGAPTSEPPVAAEPHPVEVERPVETSEIASSGPKRRGWWQRIVE
jgi:hypothetical protein